MTIRVTFTSPSRQADRPSRRLTIGYSLDEVLEAIRDWWQLRRAGAEPRIFLDRSR